MPVDELPPTSADLIAEALETGEIDEPTSLLYRTWLYFGDPKLPEKFIGEEAPYENGLLAEVSNKLDELPAEVRAQIEPYLLRPSDPQSAFSSTGPSSATASTIALESSVTPVVDAKVPPKECSTRWLTEVVLTNFRMWVCDDPAALSGFTAQEALTTMAEILTEYAPRIANDMGELIPDDPSKQTDTPSDDRIDVYALPTGWLGKYREGSKDHFPNYARTVQTHPKAGKTTSSYILVSLDHTEDRPLFERLFVHELFHAFHNTHHAAISATWWTEGVAEWAASYYVRSDSGRLHEARMEFVMDLIAPSILLTERRQRYGAYIWPFFMEQQVGADSVFDSVRALASLPAGAKTEAVIAVLDQQLDVAENYPELAVRIVNMQLAGDPISPKFQDLDANFPTARQPRMDAFTLKKEPLKLNANSMFGLGYRNYRITVEAPSDHPPDTGVLVHVSGDVRTESGKAPVLQALVRDSDGEYSRVRLAYSGDGDSVCVDEDMILVLANNSTVKLDLTEGTLLLKRLDGEPCSKIEVNDPEYFHPLFDGDAMQVEGVEGDDEPDKTRLVVTVREPDPKKINEYEVKVTVDGGTLNAPRSFTWPLSSLDNLGEGVWRHVEPLKLDRDLTDDNRPLRIDARLEKSGTNVDSDRPTVELHADQEPQCFADATVSGTVVHQIYMFGSPDEYRPYPVLHSKRYEFPRIVYLMPWGDSTSLQMDTIRLNQPDLFDEDQFNIMVETFGEIVPRGKTGSYELPMTLAYRDYTNVPWAKLNPSPDAPLPNQGNGQPQPGEELSMLKGTATIDITKNLPSAGIFEGTITGVFTDEFAYDHGTRLNLDMTFASADKC